VHREAVAEEQGVPRRDAIADLVLVDVVVQLVGDEDHDDVAARRGVGHAEDLEAALARLVGAR
jgi:hypothetical protein